MKDDKQDRAWLFTSPSSSPLFSFLSFLFTLTFREFAFVLERYKRACTPLQTAPTLRKLDPDEVAVRQQLMMTVSNNVENETTTTTRAHIGFIIGVVARQ